MTSIRRFRVSKQALNLLTLDEKKILPHLIKAVKKIDHIFLLQENQINNGANFYPRDAIKNEIEDASQRNPKIFSPFTIVKRDKSKSLISVEYHIEYAHLLKPVAEDLAKAAKISKNKSFKNYLESLINALTKGNYQEADIGWLGVKNSNLCLTIGPFERYLDKLFFIKRAYQGSIGIVDQEKTKRAKFIRDILYSTTGSRLHRVTPPSIVDIEVQQSLILSGFLGRALFSRQHLPPDSDTTERYGSRILGFSPAIDFKFNKLIYPIFNAIFEHTFRLRYSKKLLRRGNYYYVLLTAIAQQLHRYHNSRSRLKELFPVFDEANCVASGIQHAKHLILKGVINQKELEAIMIAQICWAFSELVLYKKSTVRADYLNGDAMIFNFLVRVGALQEKNGISWPNFAKIFFEMENLATIFTRTLQEGSYQEGQEFLAKYVSLDALMSFEPRLASIKPI